MKFLSKLLFLSLALCATFALASCGGDDDTTCANCTESEVNNGNLTLTLSAINNCVGDDNGAGGTFTQEDIDNLIASYEAGTGSCN